MAKWEILYLSPISLILQSVCCPRPETLNVVMPKASNPFSLRPQAPKPVNVFFGGEVGFLVVV